MPSSTLAMGDNIDCHLLVGIIRKYYSLVSIMGATVFSCAVLLSTPQESASSNTVDDLHKARVMPVSQMEILS